MPLRLVKTGHTRPLLTGAVIDIGASTATLDRGGNDFSVSRTSQGNVDLTQRQLGAYKRGPLVLATPDGVGAGTFGAYISDPASGVTALRRIDNTGTAQDGKLHTMLFGWESRLAHRISLLQIAKCTFPGAILQGYRYSGSTNTFAFGGTQATAVKNGTGDYTFTFTPAFAHLHTVLVMASGLTAINCFVDSFSATGFTFKTETGAGVATDTGVHIFVLGSKNRTNVGRHRRNLQSPHSDGRLLGGRIDSTGSIDIGTGDFTVNKTGTGEYQMTILESPFRQLPTIMATAKTGRIALQTQTTKDIFTLQIRNAADSADLDDDFNFVCLGYDQPLEYSNG